RGVGRRPVSPGRQLGDPLAGETPNDTPGGSARLVLPAPVGARMVPRPRSPAGSASDVSPSGRARMARSSAAAGAASWAPAAGTAIATAASAAAPIRPPSDVRIRSRTGSPYPPVPVGVNYFRRASAFGGMGASLPVSPGPIQRTARVAV